jgi:hypothetical protein
MTDQERMIAFFTALYGRAPELDGGVYLWHGLPPG